MSTQQRIEQIIDKVYPVGNEELVSDRLHTLECRRLFRSDLTALLLSLQDEQIMKCRIKANQAGCTESVDRAIPDTEYAYNPKPETA